MGIIRIVTVAEKRKNKERRQQVIESIQRLKEKEQYDEIFSQYGRVAYARYVPRKYRKSELKKLKKEGKYEDIYSKYGETEYNKILYTAKYREIKEARGTLLACAWRGKQGIVDFLKKTGAYSLTIATALSSLFSYSTAETIKRNSEQYSDEISSYNQKIDNMANIIEGKKLSDIQKIMGLIDNMWENIQGYGTPKKDINGFLELDLDTEEGYGVCRNMSSDIAKKLQKMNYNARTLAVYVEDGNYTPANVNIRYAPDVENEESSDNQVLNDILTKSLGNHMIVLVDIPQDNIILAVDPTNAGLGVYLNGKITMFNSSKENGLKLHTREYTEAIGFEGGIERV